MQRDESAERREQELAAERSARPDWGDVQLSAAQRVGVRLLTAEVNAELARMRGDEAEAERIAVEVVEAVVPGTIRLGWERAAARQSSAGALLDKIDTLRDERDRARGTAARLWDELDRVEAPDLSGLLGDLDGVLTRLRRVRGLLEAES